MMLQLLPIQTKIIMNILTPAMSGRSKLNSKQMGFRRIEPNVRFFLASFFFEESIKKEFAGTNKRCYIHGKLKIKVIKYHEVTIQAYPPL